MSGNGKPRRYYYPGVENWGRARGWRNAGRSRRAGGWEGAGIWRERTRRELGRLSI